MKLPKQASILLATEEAHYHSTKAKNSYKRRAALKKRAEAGNGTMQRGELLARRVEEGLDLDDPVRQDPGRSFGDKNPFDDDPDPSKPVEGWEPSQELKEYNERMKREREGKG